MDNLNDYLSNFFLPIESKPIISYKPTKFFENQSLSIHHPQVIGDYVDKLKSTFNRDGNDTPLILAQNVKVTITVQNKQFLCIRSLFAIHSEKLEKLFYSKTDDQLIQEIDFLDHSDIDISQESFEIIRKWCYGLDTQISLDQVIDILICKHYV